MVTKVGYKILKPGLILVIISIFACGPKPSAEKLPEYKSRAERYISEGRYDKGIKELHKILKVNEMDAATYRTIAECFEKLGEADSAIIYYEGAIVFNPTDREAYERIGDLYFNKTEPHEAMTWFDRAQQIGYLSSHGYTRLGLIYQNWNELDRARKYYEYAIAVDSANGDAFYGLGTVNLADGDTVSALQILIRAFDLGVQARAAFKLGQIYAGLKSYDKAIEWLDECLKVVDIDPSLKEQAFQLRMEIVMKMKSGQN